MDEAKKIIATNLIAIFAGIISFLLALNLRSIAVEVYIVSRPPDAIPWAASLINAISIIVLMLAWVIYIFCTHHYFDKKCPFTKKAFFTAAMKYVVPIVVIYFVTEAIIRFT